MISSSRHCVEQRNHNESSFFQLYAKHLHKRTSWLCCLPFCCSLSQSIQAQTPARPPCPQHLCCLNHFMWLSLWAVRLCHFSTPYQMVPVVKSVEAQQAQPKARCFLTSFDFVLSLCILLLCLLFISSQMARTLMCCCHSVYGTSWGLQRLPFQRH